jgi:hypothetical protein
LGKFRQGGSIGFDGRTSYATVEQAAVGGDGIVAAGLHNATGLTLGLVAHPHPVAGGHRRGKVSDGNLTGVPDMALAFLAGSFQLALVDGRHSNTTDVGAGAGSGASDVGDGKSVGNSSAVAAWRVRWTVWTTIGLLVAESSKQVVVAGKANIIKATYNGSASSLHIFVDNILVARTQAAPHSTQLATPPSQLKTLSTRPPLVFGVAMSGISSTDDESLLHGNGSCWYKGSLEEIYLKNVTTETRATYVYTDNVRPSPAANVRIFDFVKPEGRSYFAVLMSNLLNSDGANFDVTQWDGFEIQLLVAGSDFPRSARTATSGLYRGDPAPDWYHVGWPMLWGQSVLNTMEDTIRLTNNRTAVEASFMAPGAHT